MTIRINTRTFVGISTLLLQRQSDGVIFSWPQPETFVVNTNIEERIQTGRDTQGRRVRLNTYVAGEEPDLTIQYNYQHPEMVAFLLGRQMATGTFDTFLPRQLVVEQASYPGAATGFLYNGVLAATAESAGALAGAAASYTDANGISVPLTRQAFASFDGASPANDYSFAVGDDGALLFSDNLVAEQTLITLLIPANISGSRMSETLVGPMRMYATLVDSNAKVALFEAPNVSANLSGRSIDFNAGSAELGLYLNNVPGTCGSWNLFQLDQSVECT